MDVTVEVVGREAELSSCADFLASELWPRALVLTGKPGIGKTTLWDAAVAHGRERGMRLLSARGSGADTRLSFAALIDLLDGIADEDFAHLPRPQRSALDVALYRTGFILFQELSKKFEYYSGALDYTRKAYFAAEPGEDPFAGFLRQIEGWMKVNLTEN